jgi:hypothetical protein
MQRDVLALKLTFVAIAVIVPTWTLWVRQSDDALLAVNSFVGGLAQVTFWSLPTFATYLIVPRTRAGTVTAGVVIVGLLLWVWWTAAHDWHSTASFGPGFVGWLLGPAAVLLTCAVTRPRRRR